MKLIFCPACQDVIKLHQTKVFCSCKKSWGNYLEDGLHAVIGGEAIPMGFSNDTVAQALNNHKKGNTSHHLLSFSAFFIQLPCPTVEKEK